MTPFDLLAQVKSHFTVLLADESALHSALLQTSIKAFQNRAGARQDIKVESAGEYALPSDFLSIYAIKDPDSCAVFSKPYRKMGDTNLYISFGSEESYPLTITYFVNLSKLNLSDDHLPDDSIELIGEHLRVQLEIANNERIRRIENLADGDTSSIPSETEKKAELLAIEERMTNEFAFVGMLSL